MPSCDCRLQASWHICIEGSCSQHSSWVECIDIAPPEKQLIRCLSTTVNAACNFKAALSRVFSLSNELLDSPYIASSLKSVSVTRQHLLRHSERNEGCHARQLRLLKNVLDPILHCLLCYILRPKKAVNLPLLAQHSWVCT